MDESDNGVPLHITGSHEGEIEAELGKEVLEFVHRRLRERFPDQAHRPNCPNCTTSILWEALRRMLEDESYTVYQKLQATESMCDMVAPSTAALRVQIAVESGEAPNLQDVLYLAQQGFLTAEVLRPEDVPQELRDQMAEAGITWVSPDGKPASRKFDA